MLTVPEYSEQIFDHMLSTESALQPSPTFMSTQTEITETMRGILIDWLVEVHVKFKLLPETIYLTTNLIDRYLTHAKVNRNKLQLVGVASMLIATKYEEIYAPEVRDFVYITDNAYTADEILEMEYRILKALDFDVTTPS